MASDQASDVAGSCTPASRCDSSTAPMIARNYPFEKDALALEALERAAFRFREQLLREGLFRDA